VAASKSLQRVQNSAARLVRGLDRRAGTGHYSTAAVIDQQCFQFKIAAHVYCRERILDEAEANQTRVYFAEAKYLISGGVATLKNTHKIRRWCVIGKGSRFA